MPPEFPLLRQPFGSQSCLPTCVRAIFQWQGSLYSAAEVSEWCREEVSGCAFDDSIEGLIEAGFELDTIPENDSDAMLAALRERLSEGVPVVVALQMDARTEDNHAVVTLSEAEGGFTIMDPLQGSLTEWPERRFLLAWACTGFLNFWIERE
jgi:hypothetical protein